ncbi:glycoside hydrolase family 15 protein [Streptomyces acidiscabies]|uniref:Glycoside hydrolase family 15 protein n=1 Tax=Streptomyces acidiscabies TaxID=42234 RepID=A0ABU4MA17_9ACTN|nr:glycoside hydrolase family 15 protein [Streptomyces acidiscabies]MDX3024928.1 glycoside hydrolase family 15 protein [Streptomyces acidiscabies]
MSAAIIEDYALVGDMESAALVCRDGSVDWLCLPRFDSDAVFAGLLGTDTHGFWRIGPAVPPGVPAPRADRRRYRGQTLVVESEWDTASGTVRVLDLMPPRHGHGPRLVRIVEGVTGAVEMTSTMRPRFGYGRSAPWIYDRDGRTVAVSGPDALWLDTTCGPSTEKDGTVVHRFTVPAGARMVLTLSWTPSQAPGPGLLDAEAALAQTCSFWEAWAAQRAYDGPHREAVIRSLLTLKALTYGPTGGIVAAPTTSLPEELGGERNYDYRFVWLRDSAVTLSALLRTGCRDEAVAWRQWLLRAVGGDPENLQIMYRLDGHRDMPERELPWLTGYEDSRPVRVGNGAVDQLQLDVPGEVIETLALAHEYGVARCEDTEALIMTLVDYVRRHWREPDDGIWEVRGGRRHFTHSKIMCWVAVDRAVRLASEGVLQADLEDLVALRAEIHAEVCAHAYDPARNTFTQSYGSKELDASLLLLPLTGFLPVDDPRVTGTVNAVRRELSPDGLLVHRYRTDGPAVGMDGFTGDEGAFLLCSFWLVDALALTGRLDEAEALFEQLLALRNDLGLMAEEYDPVARRQLGNVPQAYSMLGLVNSFVLLHDLRKAAATPVLGPGSCAQIREVTSTDCPKGQDTKTFAEDGNQQAATGLPSEPSAPGHRRSSAGTGLTATP